MNIYRNKTLLNVPLVFVLFMCLGSYSYSQNLTGPANVQPNTTHSYTFNNGIVYTFDNWVLTNGTLVSNSESGTSYTAVVQWGSVGSASITFRNKTVVQETKAVSVAQNQSSGLSNENYVYNVTPRIETTDVVALDSDEKIEIVTYFDGLGRPMQQVGIEAGGNSEDIITHIGYDEFGRQVKDYLPYSSTTALGSYRTDALSATNSFYDASSYEQDFPSMTTATINPYSEKEFDNSPLNRVMKQAAPGKDWKLGNGHEIEMGYHTNTSSTEVRLYRVNLTKNTTNGVITYLPTLASSGYYTVNELYKTITKDENHDGSSTKNHTTEEFKNKQGQVVLKRTYNNNVAHDTYYVYDDYGNLTYVLPPKSEPQSMPNTTELNELCYQYKYDQLNRLVEKKIPGKGWESIVYNILDQPILTQDANLDSQNKWLFNKYDIFGRVAYTGYITNSSTRTTLQNAANAVSTTHVTKQSSSTSLAGTTIYYNNSGYPTSNITEIYTINYYDNYTFDGFTSFPSSHNGQGIINYNNSISTQKLTKGLATGSKVRVLGTSNWITTQTGYDIKGRAIYTKSVNTYLGTTDIVKNTLDFAGAVSKAETSHVKGGSSVITEDLFTYDHSGRLKKQTQELNNTNVLEVIVENTYDDLGQLITKKVGGKTTQGRLQTVDYDYNIRGWLKAINDPKNLGNDLFAFEINYNTVSHHTSSSKKLYNGNISETEWKTNNDNVLRWYRYEYDALNRITSGIANSSNYNLTSVGYDKNGNITNLTRQGHTNAAATNFGNMDALVYTYEPYSNKLKKVLDNGERDYGFKDGVDIATEYNYDTNGNMLKDYNKGISSNILYNHLNLPTQVAMSGGNIQYIYDATGVKLKKTVSTGGNTEYAGNYIYENGTLKFFSHPEGYVEPEGSGYEYVYQYKDHLGNIRLSYKDENQNNILPASLEILEENNYYPFGLQHKGYNEDVSANSNSAASKYMFGGKEFQDDDINGSKLDWYDFHARNYDASLGRWMNIDPLADKYSFYSPYNYTLNNPVLFSDPSGMEIYNGHWVDVFEAYMNQDEALRALDNLGKNATKKDRRNAERKLRKAKNKYNSAKKDFDDVEDMINKMKRIDGEWYNKVNNLEDLNGDAIDVEVRIAPLGMSENENGEETNLDGQTYALPFGLNTVKSRYNANSEYDAGLVRVVLERKNYKIFWHEIGHTLFLTSPKQEIDGIVKYTNSYWYYRIYIPSNSSKGKGGHSPGDPSGDAAAAAEDRYDEKNE